LLTYQNILLRILLVVSVMLPGIRTASQNIAKGDSLKLLLKHASGMERFGVYQELFKLHNVTNFEAALEYARSAYQLAEALGDSSKMVEGGRMMAYSLLDLGRLDEAIAILKRSISIAQRNKERYPELEPKIKFLLNNAGIAYMYRGNHDSSLRYHFESLEIRENEGDKRAIGTALNNIGLVYFKLKNFEQALQYYQRSLDLKNELNDHGDIDKILINIGLCYNALQKSEEAITNFRKALQLCGDNCIDEQKKVTFYGLGAAYLSQNKYELAEQNYLLSLQISRSQNDKQYWIENLLGLSRVETARKNYKNSLKYLQEAMQFEKESEFTESMISLYDQMAKVFRMLSDFEKASQFQSKYIQLKDSIYSGQLIKNLAKIQTTYEQRENLKAISERDRILQLQKELISRQQTQYIFIVAVTVLATGLALVLFWANRNQRKQAVALNDAKRVITEQNEKLKQANEWLDHQVAERTNELILANESLRQVNSELDNFIYRTSHDIRGPLVTLKGICNVALLDVQDETARNYLAKLDSTSSKLNIILTRLLLVNRIAHWELETDPVELNELISDIIAEEIAKGLPPNLSIDYTPARPYPLITDRFLVGLVIENLIGNAIKFYNTSDRIKPFVKIVVEPQGDGMILMKVMDNGIGIMLTDKDMIFQLFNRASERSETGGMGLYISKLAAGILGGEVMLASTSPQGSEFHFKFPTDITPLREARKKRDEKMKQEREARGHIINSRMKPAL
jgi:signal transduction histidine kinase